MRSALLVPPLLLALPSAGLSSAGFSPDPARATASHTATTPTPFPVTGIGLGTAVLLDGDRILVGQPATAPGFPLPPAEAGSVQIFSAGPGGSWEPAGSLTAPGGQVGDEFGAALALSGDVLAVGAPAAGEDRGEVHIFYRTGDGWTHRARLRLSDAQAGDRFGVALAAHQGIVLAAAPGRDDDEGLVAVLRRDDEGGSWSEETRLTGEGGREGDSFGTALHFDGSVALVGAPGPVSAPVGPEGMFAEGGPGPRAGRVLLFQRDAGGTWSPTGALEPEGEEAGAFGAALLRMGDELLVSATLARSGTGVVHHLRREAREGGGSEAGPSTAAGSAAGRSAGERGEAGWRTVAILAPGSPTPGSVFGISLARADRDLLVGAPLARGGVGEVVVFRGDGEGWSEAQTLSIPGRGIMTQFGFALAAADGRVVVGGPLADFFVGAGYVYGWDGAGSWLLEGEVFHEGEGLPAVVGEEVPCEEGQAHLFSCEEVDLLSFLPVQELGGGRGIMVNDLWGWTHEESGREFAIVGRLDGTTFIEVTDPHRPVYLGELLLPEAAEPNLWRDIKVYQGHAYIVADAAGPHGMQVFDLHQLLELDPAEAPLRFEETAHYDRIYSAHNVVINEESGFAYIVGASMGGETCGGALHMVDIRDPLHPAFAGCFGDPTTGFNGTGYTHDAQCVIYRGPDESYRGREICFNASENALGIADVTDKENPVALGTATYPNSAYVHQGWLSEDQRHFYLNDEGDEIAGTVSATRTLIFDVEELEDPVVAGEYLGTTPASDHNLYVLGDLMYQSNYVAGLQVIDVSEPLNPREVGSFRTVPAGEIVPGFLGSWSNYPFFRSGAVGVTSMREGFFMVRFRDARMIP